MQVNDTTNGTHSSSLPFDIVVDALDSNTITLHGSGSLGIAASTPTIVYGLGGEGGDTINATGMTANVWFVGGEGADTMTGGSGVNTYLYADQSDSPLGGADDDHQLPCRDRCPEFFRHIGSHLDPGADHRQHQHRGK